MTTGGTVSGDTGGRRGIPDDLRSDAPLDLVGLVGAVQFALERANDAVNRMAEALRGESMAEYDNSQRRSYSEDVKCAHGVSFAEECDACKDGVLPDGYVRDVPTLLELIPRLLVMVKGAEEKKNETHRALLEATEEGLIAVIEDAANRYREAFLDHTALSCIAGRVEDLSHNYGPVDVVQLVEQMQLCYNAWAKRHRK